MSRDVPCFQGPHTITLNKNIVGWQAIFLNEYSQMNPSNSLSAAARSTATDNCDGVLLVGHGTRDAAGVAEFMSVAEQAARRLAPRPLEACFLEIAQPTIAAGVAGLADRGVRRLTVVPLLLFAAGHAKRDIPTAVAEAAARHGNIPARHAPPLECHPKILALSGRRYAEALIGRQSVDPAETMLVMVGRGSSDSQAAAEMRRFSRLRQELTPVGRLETCFVAKQLPTLSESLAAAAASGFRRVVVQPHLLFTGQLVGDIRREVESVAGTATEWIIAAHLGPEPELADAIVDLVVNASDPPPQFV